MAGVNSQTSPLESRGKLALRSIHFRYGGMLLVKSLADGSWLSIYAWFLFGVLQLDTTMIALLVGTQFIVQILTEIPSGALADRLARRKLAAIAFVCLAVFAFVYAWSVAIQSRYPELLKYALVLAEACFGAGQALLSGTLDGWASTEAQAVIENRFPAGRQKEEFDRSEDRLKSIELLALGTRVLAGVSALFLVVKLGGSSTFEWFWWPSCAVYLLAGLLVYRLFKSEAAGQELYRSGARIVPKFFDVVGESGYRAFSFLRERPGIAQLVLLAAAAMIPVFAMQAYWVVLLERGFGVSIHDPLTNSAGTVGEYVPFYAAFWGLGELALLLYASVHLISSREGVGSKRDSATLGRPGSLSSRLLPFVALMACGLFLIVGATLLQHRLPLGGWAGLTVLWLGWLTFRFAEGPVRSRLRAELQKAIMSERSTLASIQSFVTSVLGVVHLTVIGVCFHYGLILPFLLMAMLAAIVCVILLSSFQESAEVVGARSVTADNFKKRSSRRGPQSPGRLHSLVQTPLGLASLFFVVLPLLSVPIVGLLGTRLSEVPAAKLEKTLVTRQLIGAAEKKEAKVAEYVNQVDPKGERNLYATTYQINTTCSEKSSCTTSLVCRFAPPPRSAPFKLFDKSELEPETPFRDSPSSGESRFARFSGPCSGFQIKTWGFEPKNLSCAHQKDDRKWGAPLPVASKAGVEPQLAVPFAQLFGAALAMLLMMYLGYLFVTRRLSQLPRQMEVSDLSWQETVRRISAVSGGYLARFREYHDGRFELELLSDDQRSRGATPAFLQGPLCSALAATAQKGGPGTLSVLPITLECGRAERLSAAPDCVEPALFVAVGLLEPQEEADRPNVFRFGYAAFLVPLESSTSRYVDPVERVAVAMLLRRISWRYRRETNAKLA